MKSACARARYEAWLRSTSDVLAGIYAVRSEGLACMTVAGCSTVGAGGSWGYGARELRSGVDSCTKCNVA